MDKLEEREDYILFAQYGGRPICAWCSENQSKYIHKKYTKNVICQECLDEKFGKDEIKKNNKIEKASWKNVETIHSDIFCSSLPSGWLMPNGKLINCKWGEHEKIAGEYIRENNLNNEKDKFEEKCFTYYSKDFMIIQKRWILLDSPSGNCKLKVTYNKIGMTKKQKEYLLEYFTKIGDEESLNKIF